MLKTNLTQEVKAQQGKTNYPDSQIDFPIQDPVVHLICGTEELQPQGYLYESQHYFHTVKPASALRQLVQKGREEGEDSERKGEGYAESQHRNHRSPEFPLSTFYQHSPYYRTGAGETHQNQSQGQEKDSPQTFLARILICSVNPFGRQYNLKGSEERCRKDHKYQEEDEIRQPVCRKPVKDVGSNRIPSKQPGEAYDNTYRKSVEQYYEKPVHQSLEATLFRVIATFQEEGDGHRHHREDTRGQQHSKSP